MCLDMIIRVPSISPLIHLDPYLTESDFEGTLEAGSEKTYNSCAFRCNWVALIRTNTSIKNGFLI
jgi:hypothetical protein